MQLQSTFLRYHKIPLLFILISIVFYWSFGYDLIRTESAKLLALYAGLFILAFQLIKSAGFNFRLLVVAALLFRLIFLIALPNLSQDFYRFIWDGRMLLEGFNPYLYTPDALMLNGSGPIPQAKELYEGMGTLSSSNFTNYPPINQLCFFISALFGGKSIMASIIVMRSIIIAADIGILYFGRKLLEACKLPSSRIWWYALNPFIIIELTGNLHFEGVMLFFFFWALYLLKKGAWLWAAILFALSISVKLIPLIFLPLFFQWFRSKEKGFSKMIFFYTIVGLTTLLLFLPFFSFQFIDNYSKTVGLWFTNFEFNASVYYLLRKIGYMVSGYNQIGLIGKILPLITFVMVIGVSFLKKQITLLEIIQSMVLVFAMYLFLSTTVHPWYLATLVLLCIFTSYKFPLLWSLIIILSYLAYTNYENTENLWIIGLEYTIVFVAFIWEVFFKKSIPFFGVKKIRRFHSGF